MAISQTVEYTAMTEMIMSIMGVDRFAYVKSVEKDEGQAYAVHAADGTRLAIFHCRDEAFSSIKRHNLTPVNVH